MNMEKNNIWLVLKSGVLLSNFCQVLDKEAIADPWQTNNKAYKAWYVLTCAAYNY